MDKKVLNFLEIGLLTAVSLLSTLISIMDWLGLLETVPILHEDIPTLTLLTVGLVAGYLTLERKNNLKRIEEKISDGLLSTQSNILDAISLGQLITQDKNLHSKVKEIAESYLKIKAEKFPLFIERSHDLQQETVEIMNGMERGYLITPYGSKYNFGKRGVLTATKSLKAVSYKSLDVWRSEHHKDVLNAERDAHDRKNVSITRIFIISNEMYQAGKDVLEMHKASKVNVRYVLPEALPPTQRLSENS